MDAVLVSTAVVAIAEIGDKTQLLALLLAARFRRPFPIVFGIFFATLANHALAAWAGTAVAAWIGGDGLRWVLGLSFLAMAVWIMSPDKACDKPGMSDAFGPFLTTLVAFFLVEIGDKTQIATVALAARFDSLVLVTVGTTLGIMIANVPAVFLGGAMATRLPLRLIHGIAAAIFAVMGILMLIDTQSLFAGF